MKRFLASSMLALVLTMGITNVATEVKLFTNNCSIVHAEELEDDFEEEYGEVEESGGLSDGELSKDDKSVGDYIKGQRGMTGEQLEEAGRKLSPLTNIIGYFVGGVVVIIFAAVFAITALDLLYIVLPPLRNVLYKAGTDGTGAMTGGMVGGGGYGMRGGYGAQAGMVGGAAGGTAKPTQWISDEAVQCAAMLGGSAQSTPIGGAMPGVGGQMPQNMPMKSVIGTYFKKRVFFMILLAICVIVLTSSVLLGTGVNLAEWIVRMIDGLNNSIPK